MDLFSDYTLRVVAMGSGVLGATSGVLGSFAVLRRQSLLGDALSHAALPGIVLAFVLTSSKAPLIMMAGAAIAGWVGTLAIRALVTRSRIPYDSALGVVLAVFFGFGMILLTQLQKQPHAAQAGLESFLFGQAAALLRHDVIIMTILGSVALGVTAVLWKHFKVLSFDPDFARALGLPTRRIDGLLTALLVVAVVIGLQTVGVVLMSAMLVAPGAAARQWTNRLSRMVVIASLIGAVSGVAGAILSSIMPRMPTGPTIVLILSGAVIVSLLFAPARGMVWRWIATGRRRTSPPLDPVLMQLYALAQHHLDDPEHGHSVAVLRTMNEKNLDVAAVLQSLEARSLACEVGGGLWAPTSLGRREAQRLFDRESEGVE
ncbi:MAG: metal ABC transporter permease [bacterium]|nr:metal ABC transporter permease [bacterium]